MCSNWGTQTTQMYGNFERFLANFFVLFLSWSYNDPCNIFPTNFNHPTALPPRFRLCRKWNFDILAKAMSLAFLEAGHVTKEVIPDVDLLGKYKSQIFSTTKRVTCQSLSDGVVLRKYRHQKINLITKWIQEDGFLPTNRSISTSKTQSDLLSSPVVLFRSLVSLLSTWRWGVVEWSLPLY